ncbi:thioesterase [Leuconostocaceae bacterium ESL0958]|nr:thioesterase [Leuconostocaceae bacterium ESL0958]
MVQSFEIEQVVQYYQVDQSRKLSLPMAFNLAILCSRRQGEALGVGQAATEPLGVGWVILQYDVTVHRRPNIEEKIRIQTFSEEWAAYFASRTFRFLDEAGEVLIEMQSLWAMIDLDKRRMMRLLEDLVLPYGGQWVKRLKKLKTVDKIKTTPLDFEKHYQVRYFDIDGNRHVNNSKYVEWMLDVLPAEFLKQHEIQTLTIRYENEVGYGHQVASQAVLQDNETKHRIENEQQTAAEASIHWVKAQP